MSTESVLLPAPLRIASVDALRGLTILLMVFVNDLGPAAPPWMLHIQPSDADGMTLADIVFPFFLFIAGVSIPLSVQAARARGATTGKLFAHTLTRTLALLLMGLVGVNRGAETRLGPTLWGLLAYVAIILAWYVVPNERGGRRSVFLTLKVIGFVALIVLLAIYRREPVETEVLFRGAVSDWTWLQTSWWGILGLIGWAYLVASVLYLALGSRREWLMAATGLLMLNYLVAVSGGFFVRVTHKPWLESLLPLIDHVQGLVNGIDGYVSLREQLGSLPAIVMAGVVLGTVLRPDSDVRTPGSRIRWCLVYATGLFIAGLMTDTFGGINKIMATPTWCLWCAALATLTWVGLYALMDVAGYSKWSAAIRPAGANPLIAYLLHPIILFVLTLTGLSESMRAYAHSSSAAVVTAGSLAMAIVVCSLTGLIARAGLRLRV